MIQVQQASLSFGSQIIFDEINLTLQHNQRVGVLGRNGTGKTTLLKIIAGQGYLDDGSVSVDRHKKLGYMPQEMVLLSSKNVLEESLSVFPAYTSEDHEEITAYDRALALEKTEKVLKGLGFSRTMFEQPVEELSVGWKMRLVLAKLLLEEADFYLFDEPTNHLDLPTKEWFFDFLKEGRFGFLLVTHDRYFLDNACDYILSLERGKAKLFRGNFSAFAQEQEQQRAVLESAYQRQQKEIARKQATIDRFKAKATKAGMAQSMMKQLEKMERIEIEPLLPTIRLSFPPTVRPGTFVLTVSKLKHSFDDKVLFQGVNGVVQRGDRIGLIAPNGTGKTTLFNLITGGYTVQQGSISFGHNVQYAVFEQDQMRSLNPSNTVFGEVLEAIPDVPEAVIRTFLGSFLFSGDAIQKKISVLSGGERNRVAMVKVLLQKANLLLLDEPTNHLDLYAKEVLLQALKECQGTMLFVSHDHSFIESLATRIWELTPYGLNDFPGTYESFLYYKKQRENQTSLEHVRINLSEKPKGKEQYVAKKELSSLENKIAKLEKEIERLNHTFFDLSYGSPEYQVASEKLTKKKEQLATLTSQWEELMVDSDKS